MKKRLIIGFLFIAVSIFASTYADMFFDGQSNIAKAQTRLGEETPQTTRQSGAQQPVNNTAGQRQITGWMWSDNIGWISLNCSNTDTCANNGGVDYGVVQNTDGSWSGYGWNQNIGWLDFDAGCPNGVAGTCSAQVVGNSLLGWAKFISGNHTQNGWSGWVSFSSQNDHDFLTPGLQPSASSNYSSDVADPAVTGYAWGSTVVGWIGLTNVMIAPPQNTTGFLFLKPNAMTAEPLTSQNAELAPSTILVPSNTTSVRLHWYKVSGSPDYTQCTLTGSPEGSNWETYTGINAQTIAKVPAEDPNRDEFSISSSATTTQSYQLSCNYDGGTHVATATVNRSATQTNQCFVTTFAWGDTAYCPPGTPGYVTPAISWSTANAGSCTASWLTGPTNNNYTSGYQTVSGGSGTQYTMSCQYSPSTNRAAPVQQPTLCAPPQPLVLNYLDANDPFCQTPPGNNPTTGVPQCRDGIDNDGDGLIDHSSVTPQGETPDNGCTGPNDNSEKLIKTIIKEI